MIKLNPPWHLKIEDMKERNWLMSLSQAIDTCIIHPIWVQTGKVPQRTFMGVKLALHKSLWIELNRREPRNELISLCKVKGCINPTHLAEELTVNPVELRTFTHTNTVVKVKVERETLIAYKVVTSDKDPKVASLEKSLKKTLSLPNEQEALDRIEEVVELIEHVLDFHRITCFNELRKHILPEDVSDELLIPILKEKYDHLSPEGLPS